MDDKSISRVYPMKGGPVTIPPGDYTLRIDIDRGQAEIVDMHPITDEQVRIVATAIAKAYEEDCIVAECDMVAARAAIEAWRAVAEDYQPVDQLGMTTQTIDHPAVVNEGIPVYRMPDGTDEVLKP